MLAIKLGKKYQKKIFSCCASRLGIFSTACGMFGGRLVKVLVLILLLLCHIRDITIAGECIAEKNRFKSLQCLYRLTIQNSCNQSDQPLS